MQATINRNGNEDDGRMVLYLRHDTDGRYRWYDEEDTDSEVSGESVETAMDAAGMAWGSGGWDLEIEPDRFYLAPSDWRQDEYRDVLTEDQIRQQFENWDGGGPDWETWEDARDDCDELDGMTLEDARFDALDLDGDNLNLEDRPSVQAWVERYHGQKYVEVHNTADYLEWGDFLPLVDTNGMILGLVDTSGAVEYVELDLYVDDDGEHYLDDEDGPDSRRVASMVAARAKR